jgi:hypothetical protein
MITKFSFAERQYGYRKTPNLYVDFDFVEKVAKNSREKVISVAEKMEFLTLLLYAQVFGL